MAAKAAGLVGRKRVLDSTPLYDAVATMDTVTLIRSAIRGLLKAADAELAARAAGGAGPRRRLHRRGQAGVRLRRSGRAGGAGRCAGPGRRRRCWRCFTGGSWTQAVEQAGALLATVLGQDLDRDEAGVFRIARRVARIG